MSQLASALVSKTAKTFTLKDLIFHHKIQYKNLYEFCSQYPNQGVGFKFWRTSWPDNCFWIVKDVSLQGPRNGKAYGILYWQGQQQNQVPLQIKNGLKRGIWKYSINNASVILDNGVKYTAEELSDYKSAITYQPEKKEEKNKK